METFPPVEITLPWLRADGLPVTKRLLFTRLDGKGAVRRTDFNNRAWKPAPVAAGVIPAPKPGERHQAAREHGMHALRHFYASVLLDAGENVKTLGNYLGHNDPGFTLRVYTHLMPSSDARARKAVDSLYESTEPASKPPNGPGRVNKTRPAAHTSARASRAALVGVDSRANVAAPGPFRPHVRNAILPHRPIMPYMGSNGTPNSGGSGTEGGTPSGIDGPINTTRSRWQRCQSWLTENLKKLIGVAVVAFVGIAVQQAVTRYTASEPGLGPTKVRYLRLFDEYGRLLPPFSEARRYTNAKCWTASAGTLDPNAWRCATGNQILDPCWYKPFSASDSNDLACVSSPWDDTAVIIETPEWGGTPRGARPTNKLIQPWAMEIRNPLKHKQTLQCTWVQGSAVQEINGMRLDWECHKKGDSPTRIAGYALGLLDTSHPLNTVPFAPTGNSEVRDADVTAIWP